MTTKAKKLMIPSIIFIWTLSSLTILNQWDLNFLYRYYTWVFTAQVAFLIFFVPQILKTLHQTKKIPNPIKFFEKED